jgi:hypothetical protein
MATSLVSADTLLVIDVGSVTTRAMIFDVVDGRYRFLASGSAPSTAVAPYSDVSEGIRIALDRLQDVTGRSLIGADEGLIMPSASDGSGVDKVAATVSAGSPIKVVLVGLLEDVSLESARSVASTTYTKVLGSISMNDRRKTEERIDMILRLRPDLILVAGGTDGGASQSVLNLLDAVGLSSYLLSEDQRPEVLFSGNKNLRKEVKTSFEGVGSVHFAPNVRPTLEYEQLDAARVQLANISAIIQGRKIAGINELNDWTREGILPTASAFGRVIRFLSKIYDSTKGVLGVDVGASATTIATAYDGNLTQGVYPELGLGDGLASLLKYSSLGSITRWLHLDIPNDDVRQYLYNKSLYPASIPATEEELAIEQAVARQVMQVALKRTIRKMNGRSTSSATLSGFEPILVSGSVLTRAPNLAQSLSILLDGLQPPGVTTVVLDQNHISAALGAAAAVNPVLTVQVLESSSFLNLGTLISPVGKAKPGTPVLRLRMTQQGGNETSIDVKQGTIRMLHLPMGKSAEIHLQPLHRFDVGMGGPGRGGRVRVVGGALGIVIDARGRPIQLSSDPVARREIINKWRMILGC